MHEFCCDWSLSMWVITYQPSQTFMCMQLFTYCQTSNIRHTLVGNKIVDRWDVVGSTACRRCSNYIFILDLTPGFNIWHKDNCMARRQTFQFRDLVHFIKEVLRYIPAIPKFYVYAIICLCPKFNAIFSQSDCVMTVWDELSHSGLVVTKIWVSIGSGNGLLPNSTKPLPEPMLTDYQWSPVTFISGQFHKRCLNHQSLKSHLKITCLKSHSNFPGANELIHPMILCGCYHLSMPQPNLRV